jgi:hypothetical protein
MHKIKNILFTLIAIILLLVIYFAIRHQVVKSADNNSDSFFDSFPHAEDRFLSHHLQYLKSDHTYALAIIGRHKDAITNFNYKDSTPKINFMLNEATVEVSWHLNIIFSRIDDGWFITKLDEYIDN